MADAEVYESASCADNDVSGLDPNLVARVLEVVGSGRAGLVTDVDGTISPIAARPAEAVVLPRAREALIGLRDRLSVVAVITGRAIADARRMVDVGGLTYIGNHGFETFENGHARLVPEARPWVPRLAAVLDQVAAELPPDLATGIVIENKGATATVHYRLAPDPDRVRHALLGILGRSAASGGFGFEEGRQVINLLPPLTVTKGTAVMRLVRQHRLDGVVCFGDDITDTHAFRTLEVLRTSEGLRTLAIGVVGRESPPSIAQLADACVPSVAAVAELLWRVLDGLKSSARMESRAPDFGSH